MEDDEINKALTGFISDKVLEGEGADLDDDTPLLEWGVIDSIAMVSLLSFIKERFGVRIPDGEVVPRNFHSIGAIGQLVRRALSERGDD